MRNPDDEEFLDGYEGYDEPDDCDCADYEADLLTGVAHCWRCENSWHMSSEEMETNLRIQAEYDEGA